MLTVSSRTLTSNASRSQTPPPSIIYGAYRNAGTPYDTPSSVRSSLASRPKQSDWSSYPANAWDSGTDVDVNDSEEQFDYDANQDEDEFGLPSLGNTRRIPKRFASPIFNDPEGGMTADRAGSFTLNNGPSIGRARANSSDIAEERGLPNYPVAKKSEGKILRPQYKDILKGLRPAM